MAYETVLITTLEVPPTEEPVELREARTHMSMEEGETIEDEYIESILIKAAREYVERRTGRAILDQTWSYYLNEWPDGNEILLPYPNLIWTVADSYIKYTDSDGTVHTFENAGPTYDYDVDTNSEPGRIVLKYGESWPSDTLQPMNPIHIYYDCGWTDPEDVPAMLKAAILLVTSDMYENREPTLIGVSAQTLKTLDRILYAYTDWTWKV